MDRRYQVFVSSTYTDLGDERSEAIQALLELDCMPAGMELFPAANETQWNWIKQIIDQSDYYIVILAGRYGSTHPKTRISYTEMEYRYAISIGKPVLAFLHEKPDELPQAKCERKPANQKKLKEFRSHCEERLCKYWNSPHDLAAKVSRGLTQLIKREPAIGWIRADQLSNAQREELVNIKQVNLELKEALQNKPAGTTVSEELASGSDVIELDFHVNTNRFKINKADRKYKVKGRGKWFRLQMTWDQILFCIAPALSGTASTSDIYKKLNNDALREVDKKSLELDEMEEMEEIKIGSTSGDQIQMQFEGLGLIEHDQSKNYRNWTPTELGRKQLLQITTLKKGRTNILSSDDFVPTIEDE